MTCTILVPSRTERAAIVAVIVAGDDECLGPGGQVVNRQAAAIVREGPRAVVRQRRGWHEASAGGDAGRLQNDRAEFLPRLWVPAEDLPILPGGENFPTAIDDGRAMDAAECPLAGVRSLPDGASQTIATMPCIPQARTRLLSRNRIARAIAHR